jgi:hypothetical protein
MCRFLGKVLLLAILVEVEGKRLPVVVQLDCQALRRVAAVRFVR